jgi:hypothetical protein
MSSKGCETCYTTISLIAYAESILPARELKYAIWQLNRNQDQLSYVQPQIDPEEFMMENGLDLDAEELEEADEGEEDDDSVKKGGMRETEAFHVGSLAKSNLNEVRHGRGTMANRGTMRQTAMGGQAGGIRATSGWVPQDLYAALARDGHGLADTQRTLDPAELDLQLHGTLRAREGLMDDGLEYDEESEDGFQREVKEEKNNFAQMGIICDPQDIQEIYVSKQHKEAEERLRRTRVGEIQAMIREYARRLNLLDEGLLDDKRVLQMKIL